MQKADIAGFFAEPSQLDEPMDATAYTALTEGSDQ